MRLITKQHAYRAFAELDRFSDEQCQRFVRATKRDWWLGRLAGLLLQIIIGFISSGIVLVIGWLALARAFGRQSDMFTTVWGMVLPLGAIVLVVLAFALPVFYTRDFLLRRRVRRVINERSKCLKCGYDLLGLSVRDDLCVKCPECAEVTQVDVSLGELQPGIGDGREFRPQVNLRTIPLTEKERRRRQRLVFVIASVLGVFLLTPAWMWAWNEWCIRSDASLAKSEAPRVAALRAHAATLPVPERLAGAPPAYNNILQIKANIDNLESNYLTSDPAHKAKNRNTSYIDYTLLGETINATNEELADESRAAQANAKVMMSLLREAGVIKMIDATSDCNPMAHISGAPSDPIYSSLNPQLSAARAITRICAGRASLAIESDDPIEFENAMRAAYTQARIAERYPSMIGRLVSIAVDDLADKRLCRALMNQPNAQWLAAIERLQPLRHKAVPMLFTIEGERLMVLDTIAECFIDPDRTRGKQRELFVERWSKGTNKYVGRYSDARDAANAEYKLIIQDEQLPPKQRPKRSMGRGSGQFALDVAMPATTLFFKSVESRDAQAIGVDIMIAIEHFRTAKGTYPEKLDELVPLYLPAVPLDRISERPFSYRRIDPSIDQYRRSYLLYTWGFDDTDNGGIPGAFGTEAINNYSLKNIDHVVNYPK